MPYTTLALRLEALYSSHVLVAVGTRVAGGKQKFGRAVRPCPRSAQGEGLLDAFAGAGLDHGGRSHLRLVVSFDLRASE